MTLPSDVRMERATDDATAGYPCRTCGERMMVKDSRVTKAGYVRRRRHCHVCDVRITTVEVPLEQRIDVGIRGLNESFKPLLKELNARYTLLSAAIEGRGTTK